MGAAHPGDHKHKSKHKNEEKSPKGSQLGQSNQSDDDKPSSERKEKEKKKLAHCSNCEKEFDPALNTSTSCRYHTGKKEMSGKDAKWNCCKKPDLESAASHTVLVAVVGSKGVGKTSIITRIVLNEWLDDIRKPGSNDTSMVSLYTYIYNGVSYIFEFSEIPEPPVDDSVEHVVAFTDAQIVLLVYDVCNQESLSKLCTYDDKIKLAKDGKYPAILVGNKTDVPELEKKLNLDHVLQLSLGGGQKVLTTEFSSKTGVGVDNLFSIILDQCDQFHIFNNGCTTSHHNPSKKK